MYLKLSKQVVLYVYDNNKFHSLNGTTNVYLNTDSTWSWNCERKSFIIYVFIFLLLINTFHAIVICCCGLNDKNGWPWKTHWRLNLFLTASSISLLSGAAPQMTFFTDDKSYSATFGCFASNTITGGTSCNDVGWSKTTIITIIVRYTLPTVLKV